MHNIVVFGDSITQGAFDGEAGGWVSRLAAHVYSKVKDSNEQATHIVFNLGISGGTSADLRRRFVSELSERVADAARVMVIIDIGGNDALVNVHTGTHWVEPEKFKENIEFCVAHARSSGYTVCILGMGSHDESRTNPLPWDPDVALLNAECAKYDEVLKRVSDETQSLYIPMHDVASDPKLLPDGDHPNAEGHKQIFERVKEYLEKAGVL